MSDEQPNILELVVQLASLQKSITPHLPAIGKKLVADQLAIGADVRKLAKAIGRSPSYTRAVGGGTKSLTAAQIVSLINHITAERGDANGSGKE